MLLEHHAQYVTLQKSFLHPHSVISFFATPRIKLKTGTANRWGTTINKPPGPIIMMSQSAITELESDHIHYTLFCMCIVPLTSYGKLCNYAESKTFSWAKLAYCDFSSSNFTVHDHILSTAGHALRSLQYLYIQAHFSSGSRVQFPSNQFGLISSKIESLSWTVLWSLASFLVLKIRSSPYGWEVGDFQAHL
jgi:hypothetical protein